MELKQYKAAIEAMLFAHAEPIESAQLAQVLEIEQSVVEGLLNTIGDELSKEDRGLVLLKLENRWQLSTKTQYGDYIKKALDTRRNTPLSPAAMEVLAIIAYNQPVSRSFIEQVRGVDSSHTVHTLLQKGLIEEAGRLDLPGKPVSFGTTDVFLRTFGITSLSELPPLHDEENSNGLFDKNESDTDADIVFAQAADFAETVSADDINDLEDLVVFSNDSDETQA